MHLALSGSEQVPELLLAARTLRRRAEATLDNAYEDARLVLEEHEPAHEALFDALMQRRKLEGRAVSKVVSRLEAVARRFG